MLIYILTNISFTLNTMIALELNWLTVVMSWKSKHPLHFPCPNIALIEHQTGLTFTHYKLIETVNIVGTCYSFWHIISLFPFLGVAVLKEMKNNFLSAKAGFVWTKLSRLVPLGFRGLSREPDFSSISVISQLHFYFETLYLSYIGQLHFHF